MYTVPTTISYFTSLHYSKAIIRYFTRLHYAQITIQYFTCLHYVKATIPYFTCLQSVQTFALSVTRMTMVMLSVPVVGVMMVMP